MHLTFRLQYDLTLSIQGASMPSNEIQHESHWDVCADPLEDE